MTRHTREGRRWLPIVLVALMVMTVSLALWEANRDAAPTAYLEHTRFSEAGCMGEHDSHLLVTGTIFTDNGFQRHLACRPGTVNLEVEALGTGETVPLFILSSGDVVLGSWRVSGTVSAAVTVDEPGWLTWAYVNDPIDDTGSRGLRLARIEFTAAH